MEEIKHYLFQNTYLLDGSDEELPSYGVMADINAIARGIELTKNLFQ